MPKAKPKQKFVSLFQETIIQRATPLAASAIQVIRISGLLSHKFILKHTNIHKLKYRHVYFQPFFYYDQKHQQKSIIDHVVIFTFKAPHSYTGEDMAEIQCHGSPLILQQILNLALESGLTLAKPGEFTKRAFYYGKMTADETQAINALIQSKTNFAKKNAIKILEKQVSFNFDELEKKILNIISHLESKIEFPEEKDVEFNSQSQQEYIDQLTDIQNYFKSLSKKYLTIQKLENGLKIGILGKPNVGKSTLMNLLLSEERVIVSDIAGTTRDIIKETISIGDYKCQLYDTAGIRKTNDYLEKLGIDKATQFAKTLDLFILVLSSPEDILELNQFRQQYPNIDYLAYINKKDILSNSTIQLIKSSANKNKLNIKEIICAHKQNTYSLLSSHLKEWIHSKYISESENDKSIALLNKQQQQIATRIIQLIQAIIEKIKQHESEDILIEEFYQLKSYFDELTLNISHEKVFDTIFSTFCIGK